MSRPSTPGQEDPTCEWAESFRPGGYHPTHLGDVFDGQYEVLRKLGYGSYSTVWLALDRQSNFYVVLKIINARVDASTEMSIYQTLAEKEEATFYTGYENVLSIEGHFEHQGPNGRHVCFVLPPMGPHLRDFLTFSPEFQFGEFWQRRVPRHIAKRVLREILSGLEFLHANGVVHGDLHFRNILVNIDAMKLGKTTVEDIRQNVDQGRPLRRLDGKKDLWSPSYVIQPNELLEYTSMELEPFVRIADLGSAFLEDSPPSTIVMPPALRSPELVLGQSLRKPTDVWSFGCLMYELLTGSQLFRVDPLEGEDYDEENNDEHLIQVCEILQPLTEEQFRKWRRGTQYFDENWKRIQLAPDYNADSSAENGDAEDEDDPVSSVEEYDCTFPPPIFDSLGSRFHDMRHEDIGEEEEKEVVQLLRWVLHPDPAKRPTIPQILQQTWFLR